MLFALMLACQQTSEPAPPAAEDTASRIALQKAALDQARGAMSQLGKTLKGQLVDTMSEQGPVAALSVCSANARGLTAQVASETGVTVGRSSLRLRNPANAAPEWVAHWLTGQGERPAEGVPGLVTIAPGPSGETARALAPLAIEAPCLTCHGPVDTLAPELSEALAQRYPDDDATGYALGDLRGAIWAEVPVSAP